MAELTNTATVMKENYVPLDDGDDGTDFEVVEVNDPKDEKASHHGTLTNNRTESVQIKGKAMVKVTNYPIYSPPPPTTNLIRVTIHPDSFLLRRTLLDLHCTNWQNAMLYLTYATSINRSRIPIYVFAGCEPAVFRGIFHWLYTQTLPSSADIKDFPYPSEWLEGEEKESVLVSLVVEMWAVARQLGGAGLMDECVGWLKAYYVKEKMAPSVSQVWRIFTERVQLGAPIHNLCVDLYLRFYTKEGKRSAGDRSTMPGLGCEDELWPYGFLRLFLERYGVWNRRRMNKETESAKRFQGLRNRKDSGNGQEDGFGTSSADEGSRVMKPYAWKCEASGVLDERWRGPVYQGLTKEQLGGFA